MNIVQEAYLRTYPDKVDKLVFSIEYNKRFKGYNANIKQRGKEVTVFLSKEWEIIDDEIKIGLIQHLLIKLFGGRKEKTTSNTRLYDTFLKKIHIAIPKNKMDPDLREIFEFLNETYFLGLLDCPNLIWGKETLLRMGSYDFNTDTITISSSLRGIPKKYVEYVMYHEMLHKKLKYNNGNGRHQHHTREFRELEKKFKDYDNIEKDLPKMIRRKRGFSGLFKSRKL